MAGQASGQDDEPADASCATAGAKTATATAMIAREACMAVWREFEDGKLEGETGERGYSLGSLKVVPVLGERIRSVAESFF